MNAVENATRQLMPLVQVTGLFPQLSVHPNQFVSYQFTPNQLTPEWKSFLPQEQQQNGIRSKKIIICEKAFTQQNLNRMLHKIKQGLPKFKKKSRKKNCKLKKKIEKKKLEIMSLCIEINVKNVKLLLVLNPSTLRNKKKKHNENYQEHYKKEVSALKSIHVPLHVDLRESR